MNTCGYGKAWCGSCKEEVVGCSDHVPSDELDYVSFGDIVRSRLGQQCQYASRYINGTLPGYPNLGKNLRFKGEPENYHSVKIHKDDVEEFISRVEVYHDLVSKGQMV